MNSVFAIAPYKFEGFWVFDDPSVGLSQEPFISGADQILDMLTEHLPDAANGFRMVFSHQPFPGYNACFVWNRAEYEGNWYQWPERNVEGWLCPALLKYFETPPKKIYVQVMAR